MQKIPQNLIEDHWNYVKGILLWESTSKIMVEKLEYYYKSAFKHGYKHGQEEIIKNDKV